MFDGLFSGNSLEAEEARNTKNQIDELTQHSLKNDLMTQGIINTILDRITKLENEVKKLKEINLEGNDE